jgi:hypothetical protein
VDILGEGNSLGVENVDWVGCKIRQQIYLWKDEDMWEVAGREQAANLEIAF